MRVPEKHTAQIRGDKPTNSLKHKHELSWKPPASGSYETLGLTLLFFCLVSSGQLYGLEKFWAFLKYSKAKTLEIDPKLQECLSKFKRLEDFRIDVSRKLLKSEKHILYLFETHL